MSKHLYLEAGAQATLTARF